MVVHAGAECKMSVGRLTSSEQSHSRTHALVIAFEIVTHDRSLDFDSYQLHAVARLKIVIRIFQGLSACRKMEVFYTISLQKSYVIALASVTITRMIYHNSYLQIFVLSIQTIPPRAHAVSEPHDCIVERVPLGKSSTTATGSQNIRCKL